MAYQNAFLVVETPHKVFAVYDDHTFFADEIYLMENKRYGSLMSYTPEDNSVKLYSKADGMSDTGISFMAYSQEADALVLIYGKSSIIDILTNDGFTTITSLTSLQDNDILNLEIDGSMAYISTQFGIVALDLKRLEIKETYVLNKKTYSACRFGQYFYAATSEGLFRGLLSSNLMNKNNWNYFPITLEDGTGRDILKLLVFKDRLVMRQLFAGVSYLDDNNVSRIFDRSFYSQINILHGYLTLTSYDGRITFYQDFNTSSRAVIDASGVSSLNDRSTYWVTLKSEGLACIKREPGSNEYEIVVSGIKINSPKRNLTHYLTYSQDKLLVVGGSRGSTIIGNPGTLMVYENNKWYNFNEDSIAQQISPDWKCVDFVSAVVDPRDPNHYYVSSWGDGLYEFKDNRFVQLYSDNNTDGALVSAIPGNNLFVRIDGLTYDKSNNLYMINAEVTNGIVVHTADGSWESQYYAGISGLQVTPQLILVDRNNQKWVNLPRGIRVGMLVFDDTKNTSAFSSTFRDQDGYDINATGYFSIAEDFNGVIWVGTDNGPITFSSPQNVQDGKCQRVIGTDSDGNPFRLMEGIKVTSIVVDGGNRKWMGTEGNGLFCVDRNSTDMQVANFTAENSLLISNNILSLALNNETGELFIATDKGLVSYVGEAIAGRPDYSNVYAYPNPVRLKTNNRVVIKGLMENSTVKITDLNGRLITQGTSLGGQFIWNCQRRTGEQVASGVYLVFASTPEGNTGVVTKIMVIK
jgi:hypothetical protein